MKTAIIVLTYNRPLALLAVLRALAPQCQQDVEVWIADDGSRDECVQLMQAGLPAFEVKLFHAWHPDTGFTAARARNMAALRAQADYLIFLDGDCVPHARWLQQHLRLARPGCFVNGSRVLLSARLSARVEHEGVDVSSYTPLGWLGARLRADSNKLTHLLPWPASLGRLQRDFQWRGIRSCNFALWRTDFEAVNGFDESFCGWGHEDADLVLRLHNRGAHRINGFCATEVFHLWHRENDRSSESTNRDRVLARLRSGEVCATQGLNAATEASAVTVTTLHE